MVRQQFGVDGYWRVVVYYDLDFNLFDWVAYDLSRIGFSIWTVKKLYRFFRKGKIKAVTCSNPLRRSSIVIIDRSDDVGDFLNSIMHEAEHVKQHMLEYYSVEDSGEPPAYTIGYLVGRMYEGFKKLI